MKVFVAVLKDRHYDDIGVFYKLKDAQEYCNDFIEDVGTLGGDWKTQPAEEWLHSYYVEDAGYSCHIEEKEIK